MSTHNKGDFEIKVTNREKIVPKSQVAEQKVALSNLDLILPPENVGIFFCYRRPNNTNCWSFRQIICTLKEALSQVLVIFKVFAGELVQNSWGEAGILCNNQGVWFVEALADIELCQLNLYDPDQSVEGKLMPIKQCGLLSVQVTELKCGGIIVACSFDHRVADAHSINMFLISWSELANSKPISIVPSFVRSLLSPRYPPLQSPSIDEIFTTISSLIPHKGGSLSNEPLLSRIYHINAEQISHLQSQVKGTKLQSFSAFMWKLISKHASVLNNNNNHAKICKIGIVVDGRTRLASEESVEKSALMSCYFGNVLSIPFGAKTIKELNEKPLSWIGREINEFLKKAMTKEHFQDLIDWVEVHRFEPILAKIYCCGRDDGPAFVVSSGLKFPMSKVEFGWGRPWFGSYHFPWGGNAGYVMPMPNAPSGGWVVYMHLTQGQLDFIEKEASHVFNRFML